MEDYVLILFLWMNSDHSDRVMQMTWWSKMTVNVYDARVHDWRFYTLYKRELH